MPKKNIRASIQFGALPYRTRADGRPQVMLLTSRETRRWVIPKGWAIKGLKPADVAEREAYEEAGLVGHIVGKKPVGSFHYEKLLPNGRLLCEVSVFLLRVHHQVADWPERAQRETEWFDPIDAAGLVQESGLADIIRETILAHVSEAGGA
ncbi:MAG: NUDIX hydrolase [Acetobacteraceae bacterium]|jgi:8-oxo-dGTP pyrophosphatase MutT (NUDIX family)